MALFFQEIVLVQVVSSLINDSTFLNTHFNALCITIKNVYFTIHSIGH